MEELLNLGISNNSIMNMLEINPNIRLLTNNEVIEKEKLLEFLGCTKNEILNIISSNALYLDRTNTEIVELVNYLRNIGFDRIDILLDANPAILSLKIYELDEYIKKKNSA